jgi:hypothetical protein
MARKKKDPQLKAVSHGGKLPQYVLDYLRAHDRPKDTLIKEAIIKVHKLKAPITQ